MTAEEEVARYAEILLDVDVELDRRYLSVREILDIEEGNIVRMGRSAGENLDVRVGGALIAFGEIVVSESTSGVRITDFKTNE